jgi:hypothetical protein
VEEQLVAARELRGHGAARREFQLAPAAEPMQRAMIDRDGPRAVSFGGVLVRRVVGQRGFVAGYVGRRIDSV